MIALVPISVVASIQLRPPSPKLSEYDVIETLYVEPAKNKYCNQ